MRLPAIILGLMLPAALHAETLQGQVTHIRDGDTIEVEGVPIRLNGLAAPEGDEPGGDAATAAMHAIVNHAGGALRCELSGEMSYDRFIGICYTPEGIDIAAIMVQAGVARDCPRFSGGRYAALENPASRALILPPYCRSE